MREGHGTGCRVVHLQRHPHPQQVSIERVFDSVRDHLPAEVEVEVHVSRHRNSAVLPRLRAVLEARRHQGDVTHVVGDVHFLTLLLDPARTVLTVHDTEFLSRASGPKAALYTWLWLRLPVRRCAVVTVPSERTRDDLLRLVRCDPAKVRVVPNPVREEFRPDLRPSLSDPPRVLLVGTWPNKNVLRSAAALAGLGCRIDVLGHLDHEQRTALQAADPDVQEHTGLTDQQVVELVRRCDLLLFPSTFEGFGLPVVEAQATGRPVVTSDRQPLTDVAGGAAELVDPEDVASIRAGVQRVLSDPGHRQALVEAGLRNVERFRPAAVAAAYAEVYAELCAASRR
jgi:glycosyltransferase involved in cell wall biosynthesis